jgi:hypothetical protein
MSEPTTQLEWRAAVDAAHMALAVHDARKFGLIDESGEVNEQRCREILSEGREHNYIPTFAAFQQFACALANRSR